MTSDSVIKVVQIIILSSIASILFQANTAQAELKTPMPSHHGSTDDQRKGNRQAPEQRYPWHLVLGVTVQETVTIAVISRCSGKPRSALITVKA
jgi:hypothetical protein